MTIRFNRFKLVLCSKYEQNEGILYMPLPHLVIDSERDWIEKQLGNLKAMSERDLCIWAYFLGTPCSILELNRIQIGDVINQTGELKKSFIIRGALDLVGDERKIYLVNKKLRKVTLNYIDYLVWHNCISGDHPDYYRGLDPSSPLFITEKGDGFSITKVKMKGTEKKPPYTLYRANSLRRHIMDFMIEGGIENPSSQSGRRTFATKLKRDNVHIRYINHLLGDKSLSVTRRLIGNDPDDMGAVAAKAY